MTSMSTAPANVAKNIIVTKDGKMYKKPGTIQTAGAVVTGIVADSLASRNVQLLSKKPILKALDNIDKLDINAYRTASDIAFKKSGLIEKGVKYIDAAGNEAAINEVLNKSLAEWINKFPELKKLHSKKLNLMKDSTIYGRNAFFVPRANSIIVNKELASVFSFHEMGHAININMGGWAKVLKQMRSPFMALSSIALLTALFKRKKADGEQPKGWFDKTTTFIKNNAGKIAFLGVVPTVLEEGLASIRGAKLAKGLLSPENFKALKVTQGKMWLTYLGVAAGMSVSTWLASKVRDAIAKPKEIIKS